MDNPFNGQTPEYEVQQTAGNTVPAFSGAFDDDSALPAMNTDGHPVEQYIPQMYGQPAPQPYMPPMYGQPVQQQYVPPMYGQPVGQYVQPVYGQPVQPVYLPKKDMDRMTFRKHCSRVGLMLMADTGLMLAVQLVVIIVAAIIILIINPEMVSSAADNTEKFVAYLMSPLMFAGGLSAIVGNMLPASLHLRKWRYKFTDPFKGDKLSPAFTLTALLTALGLNCAWYLIYYYLRIWFGDFMGYTPESSETLYTPYNMPLVGMICYLVWVCLIAPVTEEYIFRGAVLRTLSKYGSGFGIVASALTFGLMHGNMGQTPMAFLIGLVLGYVAAKSGNIRQTVFIHMANNIFASVPQILNYFLPEWLDTYEYYIEYFDYATMAFAALTLIYFIFRRIRGLSARRKRLAADSETVTNAERAWIKLEVPDDRRLPQFDSVRHKFCHFVTSGGMVFFILVCLLEIFIVSFMPYLTHQSIPGI